MRETLAKAGEQRRTLLSYLEQHGWRMLRRGRGDEVVGLCPLHRETRPSFYLNRRKNLFYCFGCGRGGDLIRLMELVEGISFREAHARLRHLTPLEEAARFYHQQLPRSPEARAYLHQRGIHSAQVIEAHAHRLCSGSLLARASGRAGLLTRRDRTERAAERARLRSFLALPHFSHGR